MGGTGGAMSYPPAPPEDWTKVVGLLTETSRLCNVLGVNTKTS